MIAQNIWLIPITDDYLLFMADTMVYHIIRCHPIIEIMFAKYVSVMPQIMFRHKDHLVEVRKTSCFGLRYPFCRHKHEHRLPDFMSTISAASPQKRTPNCFNVSKSLLRNISRFLISKG